MSKVRLLLVLFALVGGVGSLRGATFVVPPDEWLIDDSPVIVSGTVVDAHPRLSAGQDIETVFRVAVDEVLKGQLASGDLEVVEWGGRIGERWTLVPGAPRYESGKRYVIFLYPKANGEWTTQNLTLGRFEFVSSPRGEMLVRDAEEVRGWDIHGNVAQEVERSADGFLAFIRNRARGILGDPDYAIGGTLVPAPQTRRVQTTDFAGYDFADAANVGVARWNDDGDSNVNFSISGSPATGNGKNAGDGEDRIIEEDPNDIIAGAFTGSGTVAVAYLSSAGTHSFEGKTYLSIAGADIVTQNGFKTNGSSQSVFRTAMAHEVGHTLGFRHSNKSPDDQANCAAPLPCVSGSSNAVMNSSVGALNGNLQSWDTDAVRAAYGSGGDASDYTSKFCANPGCSTFTSETGRMSSPSRSFRLAQQACAPPSLSTV
ncbi:MAG TPA: hypothetical protein VFO89_11175, partial [Thermoanaerobaculia bacterium]|nr:hypothetical protein [Thermoanaerobaculia bacterium]